MRKRDNNRRNEELKRDLKTIKTIIEANNALLNDVINKSTGMPEELKEIFEDRIFLNMLELHNYFKNDAETAFNSITQITAEQLN